MSLNLPDIPGIESPAMAYMQACKLAIDLHRQRTPENCQASVEFNMLEILHAEFSETGIVLVKCRDESVEGVTFLVHYTQFTAVMRYVPLNATGGASPEIGFKHLSA